MTQRPGLYILFKRAVSVIFASLVCSFLLIEGALAAVPPPPPTSPPEVPAGGPLGYLALVGAIAGYAAWSRKKSGNRSPKDED